MICWCEFGLRPAGRVEQRELLLGVHGNDGGRPKSEKRDRGSAEKSLDGPLHSGAVEMLTRPIKARQRVFEDLISDRAKSIPLRNDRVCSGPSERQTLCEPKLEFLIAREAGRDAEADHGRLTHACETGGLGEARLQDPGRIHEHKVCDLGFRFAQAWPDRAHPFERADP